MQKNALKIELHLAIINKLHMLIFYTHAHIIMKHVNQFKIIYFLFFILISIFILLTRRKATKALYIG